VRTLAAALVLVPAAAGLLLLAGVRGAGDAEDHRPFQEMVGGLGVGPAVDLSRCGATFDPRVEPACCKRFEPLPGGSTFCPTHAPGW
jgi:hypothetical protein